MAELDFDAKSLQSIKTCQKELSKIGMYDLNSSVLKSVSEKAYFELRKVKQKNYDDAESTELLRLFSMLTQRCFSKQELDDVSKLDVYKLYVPIIDYYINTDELNYTNLESVFASVAILGNNSQRLAVEFLKEGLFSKALAVLNRDDFIKHKIKATSTNQYDAYDQIIFFLLFNSKYNEVHAVLDGLTTTNDTLANHLKRIQKDSKHFMARLNVASALAFYDNNEREIEELNISDVLIEFWRDFNSRKEFKGALDQNEKPEFHELFLHILLLTYLNATIRIAMVDSIKQQLFESNIVSLLQEIIKHGNEDFIEKSFEILASLSFNTDFVDFLKGEKELREWLRKIADSSRRESVKKCWGTVDDTLNQKFLARLLARPNKGVVKKGHIMISYHSRYKTKCTKICEELKIKGYKVWMSIQVSATNYMDAIATAIENAAVIVLCYSKDYKLNSNCRLEAEYAQELQKAIVAVKMDPKYKADGWLNSVLNGRGFIDYSNDDETFDQIADQIENLIDTVGSNNPAKSMPEDIGDPEDWDFNVVEEWFKLNKMNDLAKAFYGYSGEDLKKLYKAKQNDLDKYYRIVDKELQKLKVTVSQNEQMEFNSKLDTLFK